MREISEPCIWIHEHNNCFSFPFNALIKIIFLFEQMISLLSHQIQMSKILTLGKLDKHRSIFANQKWLHEKLHRRNRIRSSIRKVQPWKRSKTWKLKIKLKKKWNFFSFFFGIYHLIKLRRAWKQSGVTLLANLLLKMLTGSCGSHVRRWLLDPSLVTWKKI